MTSCAYVSSAASYAVIGYVYDFTGSYVPAIVFCAAIAVVAVVLILAAYRAAPQREAEE